MRSFSAAICSAVVPAEGGSPDVGERPFNLAQARKPIALHVTATNQARTTNTTRSFSERRPARVVSLQHYEQPSKWILVNCFFDAIEKGLTQFGQREFGLNATYIHRCN